LRCKVAQPARQQTIESNNDTDVRMFMFKARWMVTSLVLSKRVAGMVSSGEAGAKNEYRTEAGGHGWILKTD
jgi:hypothetical protein